ncbi:MAG TPA: hypothetical protein VGD58_28370 [Herpetosiphonaceae bacterium]
MAEGAAGTSPTGERPTLSEADMAAQTTPVEATPAQPESTQNMSATGSTGTAGSSAATSPAPPREAASSEATTSSTAADVDTASKPAPPASGNGPRRPPDVDDVTWYQMELTRIQRELDEAKQRKTVDDARKKETDAIHGQQATSKLIIDGIRQESDRWQQDKIDKKFSAATHQTERADIADKIDDAMQAVASAEADVDSKRKALVTDERAQKVAEAEEAEQKKNLDDKQKQLGQLSARIKASQTSIEKLRTEVDSAIAAEDWKRAFGKNYQLKKTIEAASTLLDSAKEEKKILDELKALDTTAASKKKAVDDAKKQLATDTKALKDAEADLKEKRDNLDKAIGAFL